jgi:hypothetical protein
MTEASHRHPANPLKQIKLVRTLIEEHTAARQPPDTLPSRIQPT